MCCCAQPSSHIQQERKGNEVYLYSSILVRTHTLKALRHGSQFYLQPTPCLPFLRKRSPDGTAPNWGSRHRIAAYYSFIDPEGMKGWVDTSSYDGTRLVLSYDCRSAVVSYCNHIVCVTTSLVFNALRSTDGQTDVYDPSLYIKRGKVSVRT